MNKKKAIIVISVCVTVIAGTIIGIILHNKKDNIEDVNSSVIVEQPAEEKPFSDYIESTGVLLYTENSDGTLAVAGDNGITGDVEIPIKYNGKFVETIGTSVFSNNQNLRKVTIHYPVNILMCAFMGSSVTSVEMSDTKNITSETSKALYSGCFAQCKSLTEFYCDVDITDIGARIFEDCSSLQKVTFISPISYIPEASFRNCSSLEEIFIPGTVSSIAEDAFEGCESLNTISGYNNTFAETWARDNGYEWQGEDG